ncbi:MAG TPA: formyltransferase family protein, partial [Chitinophagales bacterium]|nr:formyltransferase family protein [Chitinophagales bacterium]
MKLKIALFLSGSGSNARNICSYFKNHEQIEVSIILSNKENSGAKHVSAEFDIPYFIFTRAEFYDTSIVAEELKKNKIDTLVLAGFLWLIPSY